MKLKANRGTILMPASLLRITIIAKDRCLQLQHSALAQGSLKASCWHWTERQLLFLLLNMHHTPPPSSQRKVTPRSLWECQGLGRESWSQGRVAWLIPLWHGSSTWAWTVCDAGCLWTRFCGFSGYSYLRESLTCDVPLNLLTAFPKYPRFNQVYFWDLNFL